MCSNIRTILLNVAGLLVVLLVFIAAFLATIGPLLFLILKLVFWILNLFISTISAMKPESDIRPGKL